MSVTYTEKKECTMEVYLMFWSFSVCFVNLFWGFGWLVLAT